MNICKIVKNYAYVKPENTQTEISKHISILVRYQVILQRRLWRCSLLPNLFKEALVSTVYSLPLFSRLCDVFQILKSTKWVVSREKSEERHSIFFKSPRFHLYIRTHRFSFWLSFLILPLYFIPHYLFCCRPTLFIQKYSHLTNKLLA